MKEITTLSVVGLGYVGLPLVLLADKKNFTVFGLDIDQRKINSLQSGKSYIEDVSDKNLASASKASYSTDFKHISDSDAVIICVPTPVDHQKQPDLTPLKGAVASIAPFLKKNTLVVVESTVNPGVCDEVVLPLLEELTGYKVGVDIYLAHCPERINPGDSKWNVSNINRVIGANSPLELKLATKLYSTLIDAEIKPMASLKEAEAVKVVENSFRDINIAFVNELAMSFHKLGINVENVIDGAATKPFAFMPHRPGAGVGGHCIPVDPYYLIEYARGYGFEHNLLQQARAINEEMPHFTVEMLSEGLNQHALSLKNTKVTLLGLSYKPNVGDERESPALAIRDILQENAANITTYDPFIESTAKNLDEAIEGAEAIVLATGHDAFRELSPSSLAEKGVKVFIDGRNLFRQNKEAFKESGITYIGIGV